MSGPVKDVLSVMFRFTLAFVIIVAGGFVTYQAFERSWPTRILPDENGKPFRRLEMPVVKAGGQVCIRSRFVTVKQCRIHADRLIIDSNDRLFGEPEGVPPVDREAGSSKLNVPEEFLSCVPVPANAAPGPATFRTIPVAWCNWTNNIRPIYGEIVDTPFTIEGD